MAASALRKAGVAAMGAICSGDVDADYHETVIGVPPTLGYLKNLEVMLMPGARTGKGVLPGDLPFSPPIAYWDKFPSRSPWEDPMFVQLPNVTISEALDNISPFRGECAGALQLAVLLGCYHALGKDKVNALQEAFGPAFIGVWRMPDLKTGKPVMTAASRFLSHITDVPKDYKRGEVMAVPGDYLYFENKDDYPEKSPTGGWRGENCIYMGADALGAPI